MMVFENSLLGLNNVTANDQFDDAAEKLRAKGLDY